MVVSTINDPLPQFTNASGEPVANGSVFFYAPGTTTAKAVYTDYARTTAHAQPITLGTDGRPQNGGAATPVYLGSGNYKIDVKDAESVSVSGYPVDNIPGSQSSQTYTSQASMTGISVRPSNGELVFTSYKTTAGDGAGGGWYWDSGDCSALVTADTTEALTVPLDGEDGSTGAWRRLYTGPWDIRWFGGVPDADGSGGGTNNSAAFNAASSLAPADGMHIYVPGGAWRVSEKISINKPLRIEGAGRSATTLWTDSATNTVFEILADDGLISNLGVSSSATRGSSSWFFDITGGSNWTIRDCVLLLAHNNIRSASATWTQIENCVIECAPTTGVGMLCIEGSPGQGLHISDCLVFSTGFAQSYAGVHFPFSTDSKIERCEFLACGIDILIDPSSLSSSNIIVSDTFFDTSTVGCQITPTGTGSAGNIRFQQSWFSTADYYGVHIAGSSSGAVRDVSFDNCYLLDNGEENPVSALFIDGTTQTIENIWISQSRFINSALGDIDITGTVSRVWIVNNIIGATFAESDQGLRLGPNTDYINVTGNYFSSATTAKVTNTSTGTHNIFRDNFGYDTENHAKVDLTPDGNGEATWSHGLDVTPVWASASIQGDTAVEAQILSITSTTITVRFYQTGTGADQTSGTFTTILKAEL